MPTKAATLAQSRPYRPTAVLKSFSSASVHSHSPPVALAFLVATRFGAPAFWPAIRFAVAAACDAARM